jgi:hypothetical protein
MTDVADKAWACPKDGTAMEPLGRRGRGKAWRCPACHGVFLDVEGMRRDRQDRRPPKWVPVASSLVLSVVMTALVRRLARCRKG